MSDVTFSFLDLISLIDQLHSILPDDIDIHQYDPNRFGDRKTDRCLLLNFFKEIYVTDIFKDKIFFINFLHTIEPFMYVKSQIASDPIYPDNTIMHIFFYPHGTQYIYIKIYVTKMRGIYIISFHPSTSTPPLELEDISFKLLTATKLFNSHVWQSGLTSTISEDCLLATSLSIRLFLGPLNLAPVYFHRYSKMLTFSPLSTFIFDYYNVLKGTITCIASEQAYSDLKELNFPIDKLSVFQSVTIASLNNEMKLTDKGNLHASILGKPTIDSDIVDKISKIGSVDDVTAWLYKYHKKI